MAGISAYGTNTGSVISVANHSFLDALSSLDIEESDDAQITDHEAAFLFAFIRDRGIRRTLEVGCGLGKSAVAIMAATNEPHVVVDPFQDTFDRRGLANIRSAGFGDNLRFIEDLSSRALPRLLDQGERFEFVFIDGSHRFDDIFVDFYFSDMLLEPGGHVVFHDLWMRTTRLVDSYVSSNRADYVHVRCPRTVAVVMKVGVDSRDETFHREFYTGRSFLTHHAITWFSSEPETRLKSLARAGAQWRAARRLRAARR
jgi:predicted O-methyltransferase YrrM